MKPHKLKHDWIPRLERARSSRLHPSTQMKPIPTPLPLRAWTADDDRAPSSPGPLDDLPPITAAAVMRASQGLGWTKVVELSADLERRIQKVLGSECWSYLEGALPTSIGEIKRILTRPTRKPAPAKTKPQAANRRAKR